MGSVMLEVPIKTLSLHCTKEGAHLACACVGARLDELHKRSLAVRALVDQQADDAGLWYNARTAPEAYLQQELRRLHRLVEEGQ